MNQSPWRANREQPFDYYAVVPHPTSLGKVLLMPDGDSWTLPKFVSTYQDFRSAGHLNEAMKSHFGIDTFVTRCLRHFASPDDDQQYRVYAFENHSPDGELPDGGKWVGRDELTELACTVIGILQKVVQRLKPVVFGFHGFQYRQSEVVPGLIHGR